MAGAVYWIANGLIGVGILAGLFLWARFFVKKYLCDGQNAPLLPVQTRNRPFWNAQTFLLVYFAHQVVLLMLFQWMLSQGWIQVPGDDSTTVPDVRSAILKSVVISVGGLVAIGIAAVCLWLSAPPSLWFRHVRNQLGLSASRSDVRLGLTAALMILPPVLLISLAASWFVPYEHQVLKDLAGAPTLGVFVTLFASTVIITPIVEELMFRLLLQGGLQGMVDQEVDEQGFWRPRSHWPVFATSGLFAVLHYGQGAAHYPLFFLALGLGYLYRQTGNLIAPIMVHMILNGLTLTVMFSEYRMTL